MCMTVLVAHVVSSVADANSPLRKGRLVSDFRWRRRQHAPQVRTSTVRAPSARPPLAPRPGADPERSPACTTRPPAARTVGRNALRSPRMLRTEVLAGLVVALALIPEAISFSIIAGRRPAGRAVRVVHDGRLDRLPRRPSGDDLRRDRRGRAGHRAGGARPRLRLPHRHRAARRRPPGRARPRRGRPADAVHPALGHGRLRQRPRHPDLPGPGAAPGRRAVAGLPDDRRRHRRHRRPPAGHQGRPRPAGRHRRADRLHPARRARRARTSATRASCPTASPACSSPTCR